MKIKYGLSAKKRIQQRILTVVAAVVTLIQIVPIAVIILNSMRENSAIDVHMMGLPTSFYLENYVVAWKKGEYFQAYLNSILIGVSSALLVLIMVGFAVYGLVKMECYFAGFFRNYFVAGLAIPTFSTLVPLYFIFHRLGLVNNHLGMILIFTAMNISFNFMFLYAFFQGLPTELDEAARIDGASELQNFWYNVIPLAKPIFTSMILIVFVNTWNEFLFSNTFLQDNEKRTVALRFYNFVGRSSADYGYIYASAIISILPIVVVYLLMQNSFIEGMTAGSVKG